MKNKGSEIFDTHEMKTDEVVLFASVARNNGLTNDEILEDISFIDDLLCMQKMTAIINSKRYTVTGRIRKNASFQELISNRIGFK
jgi:fructose-1,6-bisphosphatase/sedoheptulose 1,7-bisphosphatase-like protein